MIKERHKYVGDNSSVRLNVLRKEEIKKMATVTGTAISPQRSAFRLAVATFVTFGIYATVRYNIFGSVPFSDWPVYIFNKVSGLTSLGLMTIAVFNFVFRRGKFNSKVIYFSGLFAIVHSLMSLMILSPEYYGKFYEGERLTFPAGLSMALGIVVMIIFFLGGKNAEKNAPAERIRGIAAIAFASGLHAGISGFSGWFTPAQWPGGMPPLTLISFIIGTMSFLAVILNRTTKGAL